MAERANQLTLTDFRNFLSQREDLTIVGEIPTYPQINAGHVNFYGAERFFEVITLFAGMNEAQYSPGRLNLVIDSFYQFLSSRFLGSITFAWGSNRSGLMLGNVEIDSQVGFRVLEPVSFNITDPETKHRVEIGKIPLGKIMRNHSRDGEN